MEMSITKGLVELKTLGARIERATREAVYVAHAVGKKPVNGFASNAEFEERVKAAYQSVQALIRRRQEIKSAIVKSNALTGVSIAGEEMTVAEAIERKQSIQFEKNLLEKLRRDAQATQTAVDRVNHDAQLRLDKLLEQNFGKDTKTSGADIDAIANPFREQNEAKLVDPLKARDEIEALQRRIEDFEAEVDFVLSESNTLTKISVSDC